MTSKITPANPQPVRRLVAYGMSGASQAVNVSPTKLRLEIAAKRLRARKLGSRTLITADDLEAWASALPDNTSSDAQIACAMMAAAGVLYFA